MEIWKDIAGYENKYQVSNHGRVRSINYNNTGQMKILKPYPSHGGYLVVTLCKEGKRTKKRLHRLVAEAFLENPDNKPEVNHIDGDKTNNYASNLEYMTCKENIRHAWDNGLCEEVRELSRQSIIIAQESRKKSVRCITTNTIYDSVVNAARQTGATRQNIDKCCKGERKSAGKLPDGTKLIWEYI